MSHVMTANKLLKMSVELRMRPRSLRGELRPAIHMKSRQGAKIREIGDALLNSGITALDEQADVLGLPRSTTWTIMKSNHKCSGLSASTINRMMMMPRLPVEVRARIIEYVEEKIAGRYGDSAIRIRQFTARLAMLHGPIQEGEEAGCSRKRQQKASPRVRRAS